jgi:hypothetical protein
MELPSTFSYSSNPATYELNTTIAENIPAVAGGPGITFSIAPNLPPGLILNSNTGIISGTPSAFTADTSYVVTRISTNDVLTSNLNIKINDQVPSNLKYSLSPANYNVGGAILNNTPTSSGGGDHKLFDRAKLASWPDP